MSYTQDKQNIETCTGCGKKCVITATPITCDYPIQNAKTYYMPAFDNMVAAAYIDSQGKKHATKRSNSAKEAIEVAKKISEFCCYHMQNVK